MVGLSGPFYPSLTLTSPAPIAAAVDARNNYNTLNNSTASSSLPAGLPGGAVYSRDDAAIIRVTGGGNAGELVGDVSLVVDFAGGGVVGTISDYRDTTSGAAVAGGLSLAANPGSIVGSSFSGTLNAGATSSIGTSDADLTQPSTFQGTFVGNAAQDVVGIVGGTLDDGGNFQAFYAADAP
jgi:hypothetical protein